MSLKFLCNSQRCSRKAEKTEHRRAHLEGVEQLHDVRVVHFSQHIPFCLDMLHLSPLQHLCLVQLLDGKYFTTGFLSANADLKKQCVKSHNNLANICWLALSVETSCMPENADQM